MLTPTGEQAAAIDSYRAGGTLLLRAGAGTGKTSTLRMLAAAEPGRCLYLAFNRAVADEAKRTFPGNCTPVTAHALAMRMLRRHLPNDPAVSAVMGRLQAPLTTLTQLAKMLGIRQAVSLGEGRLLQPNRLARLARDTVTAWCYSADPHIETGHVPAVAGADPGQHTQLVPQVVTWARRLWAETINPAGVTRTSHDHYLKLFATNIPATAWGFDAVYLDEAQDSNPIMVNLIADQIAAGTHAVIIGDEAQAIYGWRGATDAMSSFPEATVATLTTSFRFGPAIATEANRWLDLLKAPIRLNGSLRLNSRIVTNLDPADAVLCRTNAEAAAEVIDAHTASRAVALVGGGQEIVRFAEAALDLKVKGRTSHTDLSAFTSWGAVQGFVEHDGGDELATMVKLIDTYGPETIITAINRTVTEDRAQVVISTAHKAKGREWQTVRIADDFHPPADGDEPSRPDLMLAYVAVTRAQQLLDRGGLAWIDAHTGHRPSQLTVLEGMGDPLNLPGGDTTDDPTPAGAGTGVAAPPAVPYLDTGDPNTFTITVAPRIRVWIDKQRKPEESLGETIARLLTEQGDDHRQTHCLDRHKP